MGGRSVAENGRKNVDDALGFGRVSCIACLLRKDDLWVTLKPIAESRFRRIAQLERNFGVTIKKGQSVEDMARKGREFVSDKPDELRRLAMSCDAFTKEHFFLPEGEVWKTPAGAYKRCGG